MTTLYRLCTVIVSWPILLITDVIRVRCGLETWAEARQKTNGALRWFWENGHAD